MKIKEEQLKKIQDQQQKTANLLNEVGYLETRKHALLHEVAGLNEDINEFKSELEKEYGKVNINLEDGTYTEISEEEVEELETSNV
jgi:archaellum component FlaC